RYEVALNEFQRASYLILQVTDPLGT
ncbi:unnamed protein product, partial [Cuscuta campestris]